MSAPTTAEVRERLKDALAWRETTGRDGSRWATLRNVALPLAEHRDELAAEVARLREALDRDRTGLAQALAAIVTEVRGRAWVAESRGPYKWDDDRYKAEAGAALRKVRRLAEDALRASGAIVGETLTSTKHDAAKGAGR